MKVLSVNQPYGSLLCLGIKDIENRTWPTNHRGRLLIHATAGPMRKDLTPDQISAIGMSVPQEYEYPFSAIIGSVEVVDCVMNHPSVWAEKGVYNWVVRNPILFKEPIGNIKGRLGLWNHEITEEEYQSLIK